MRATRHTAVEDDRYVASNFFDELNPHLRDVKAQILTGTDLIHAYLLRRPARMLQQISQRIERDEAHIRRLMEEEPERFVCERGLWSAIPQPAEAKARRQTLPVRVAGYLRDHGPATAPEIGAALGVRGNAIFEILSRGIPDAVVVGTRGTGKRRANIWGIR